MMKENILVILIIGLGLTNLNAQCIEDCVWPGDANANGIANHLDLLTLGLSWLSEGPQRTNPTTDWEGQNATNWTEDLPVSGINFKHSDANGDGQVFFSDIEPITNNFGKTNDNFTGLLGNNFIGDDLKAIPSQAIVNPGTTFEIDLQLGSEDNQIEGIYGIGFTLNLPFEYIGTITSDFSDSWLTDDGEDLLTFEKFPADSNKVFLALSRKNLIPISGFGHIGRLEIVIVDIIDALEADSTTCLPVKLQLENILAINEMEEELIITGDSSSLMIKHASQLTAVATIDDQADIHVFPNPVHELLTINWGQLSMNQIQLFNAKGQLVKEQNITTSSSSSFSVKGINTGIYCLVVKGERDVFRQKIVIL